MRYHNLTLLGTSHIAVQSLDEVKRAIAKEPDLVALELDRDRLFALLGKTKKRKLTWRDVKKIGVKGILFSMIGEYAEHKLGEQVGIKPGAELKLAAELAAKNNIKVVLIDQKIQVTLKRLSNAITWRAGWNFVVDFFKALLFKKKRMPFDLRTVPSKTVLKRLIKEVKIRYPNIYKVLVEERNIIMAKRLAYLMKQDPDRNILAIIGAGHEEEMLHLIKENLKA